jgi:hypothetical protein
MNKAWLMLAREDMLQLKLYSAISSVEDGLGRIRQLVKCLQARDDGLSPATFDGKPVSLPAIEMELSKARTQPHTILTLSRDSCPWADYALGLFSRTMHLSIEIQIQFSYFSEPGLEINRAESVLAFVREISSFLQPVYGYCHSSADIDLGKKVAPLAVLSGTVIEEMYWLNYFGSKRAAEISHERLLKAPGYAYSGPRKLDHPLSY